MNVCGSSLRSPFHGSELVGEISNRKKKHYFQNWLNCWVPASIAAAETKTKMGGFVKLLDLLLFVYFLLIAIVAPLFDGQVALPKHMFPPVLVDLKSWYTQEYGDYLVSEKPHFFVGLIWLELLFAWPLSLLSLYAIAAGKSWINTTCLLYGVSTLTAMVAILSEMKGSEKASDKLLMVYYPFLGFAVLAILRGLLPHSGKSMSIGKRSAISRKKRA
ncbi:uncharacterized protein LOC129893281 [Solanum dulcamara]|uniref:uncharacterized protein LOC129893281 n=1 Tax=Solanum dulcamara TaxID=45834 RepID=UPI0024850EBD|nr:uncharacterized protein LOC129893281 [Solanum dulcamara]